MNISLRAAIRTFTLSIVLSVWALLPNQLCANAIPFFVDYDRSAELAPNTYSELDAMEPEIRQRIQNLVTIVAPVYNPYVRSYLNTYIQKYPQKTEEMLGRTTIYFPLFEKLLRENDMPEELKYLAIIESSLIQKATSRSGAVGLWQFMRPTGREYGLRVTRYVDERMDPEKATRSAIKYLKYLYRRFDSWELAMAAYNAGPGRVNSAIRRSGTRDYWKLVKYLPRETRAYVPGFIAAMYVYNHHQNHGLQINYPSSDYTHVAKIRLHKGMSFSDISEITGVSIGYLKTMNAKFIRNYVPASVMGYDVFLPDYASDYLTQYLNAPDGSAITYKNFTPIAVDGAVYEEREVAHTYYVKSGDNLYTLAQHNNCTVSDLKNWNGLSSSRLDIGQRLKIYYREMVLVTPPRRKVHLVQPLRKDIGLRMANDFFQVPDFNIPNQSTHLTENVTLKRRHGLRDQLMLVGVRNIDEVLLDNKIADPNQLSPGQVMKIRGGQ